MKIDHPHVPGIIDSNVKNCPARDFVKEAAWRLFRNEPLNLERFCSSVHGVSPDNVQDEMKFANWLGGTATNRQQSQCNAVVLVCGFVKFHQGRR
jgi:hypothetical protein